MRLKLAYTLVPRSRSGRPPRRVPLVPLEVRVTDRDGRESWHELPFLLDTGSDHCLMHHDWAEHTGVVIQGLSTESAAVHTSAGDVAVRIGRIHVRIGGNVHEWKCGFIVPSVEEGERFSPDAHAQWVAMEIDGLSQARRFLLGRSEFLAHYLVVLDGEFIIITDRRKFFRFLVDPVLWLWNAFFGFLHF